MSSITFLQTHYDYIGTDTDEKYRSDLGGTNRFATVLFYLNDVLEGGETVFANSNGHYTPPPDRHKTTESSVDPLTGELVAKESRFSMGDVDEFLRVRNITEYFPVDGFERNMLVRCRSNFAIRPVKLAAALFYSQLPDGSKDRNTEHGGCPVLEVNE